MSLLKVNSIMEETEALRAEVGRLKHRNELLETEATQKEVKIQALTKEVVRSKKALKRYKLEMGIVLAPVSLAIILLFLSIA